jgi:subtilisin family serine protease
MRKSFFAVSMLWHYDWAAFLTKRRLVTMIKKNMKLLSLGISLSVTSLIAQPIVEGQGIDPSRLVVQVKAGSRISSNAAYKYVRPLFGNYAVVGVEDLADAKIALAQDPAVSSVEYNYKTLLHVPRASKSLAVSSALDFSQGEPVIFNDALAPKLWGLTLSKEGINLNNQIKLVADKKLKKSSVIVAVVDTGLDVNHPDLKGKVWVNTKEIPGNKIDDDKNGYIDDVNGINTLVRDSQGRPTADLTDTGEHGTHVAGTIAAVQNNKIGIAGVSSEAKIMSIRTVPNEGDETDVDVAESFLYAAKNGARVINCSFGKKKQEKPGLVEAALDEINKKYNVLVVVAAGNDGVNTDVNQHYPSSLPAENILAVAATQAAGPMSYSYLTYFSNYGVKSVDVAAPGSRIYSTTPNNTYQAFDGTSMASPHVAGVAAELVSLFPKLTNMQIKKVIMDSVRKKSSLVGKLVSPGLVDLYAATLIAEKISKTKK